MKKNFLVLISLLFSSMAVKSQWTSDTLLNTPVRALSGLSIYTPLVASSNDGTTYFCWFENVSGNYEMHMQRLDSAGHSVWSSNGIAVSTFPQSSAVYRYDMVTDKNGDAVLAFQDIRVGGNLNIVAYKVDKQGNLVWGSSGVQLLDSTATDGMAPRIGITSANEAVIAWNASSGSAKWVAFHKITASGSLAWNAVHRIKTTGNKYSRPVVVPASGDEFMIQYVQETGNFPGVTSTMYLDKFYSNGSSALTASVKVSNKTIPYFTFPSPIYDGNNGIFISFQTSNPASLSMNDTYVQHVTASGQQWSLNGTEAASSTTLHKYPVGKAIFDPSTKETWALMKVQNSGQNMDGIFVQKMDSLGNVLLSIGAKQVLPIVASMNTPLDWQKTNNGFIVFYKTGSFGNEILRAVKIDFSGNTVWNNSIVSISAASSGKSNVACSSFQNDQVVLGWLDDRAVSGVYAQNIDNNGTTGVLATNKKLEQSNDYIVLLENPSHELSLEMQCIKSEQLLVELFDISGKKQLFQNWQTIAGSNRTSIPSASLSSGIYFVLIRNTEGKQITKRWIKN